MSDMETRLRELLDAKAGEMRIDPGLPRQLRRRAGRRRIGTGLAAGVVAVALVAAAGAGIRAAIGDRPQGPGSGDITEPGPAEGAGEVRSFVRDFMKVRNIEAVSAMHDVISRQAMNQYEAGENGLTLYGPIDDPAFTGFGYRIAEITPADGDRYEVRVHISERFDGRTGEEYIERLFVGPGRTLRGDDLPLVILEVYRLGPSPEQPPSELGEAEVRDFATAFLEARLAGSGAEAFLTDVAARQYGNHRRGAHLYGEEHEPGLGGNYRGAEIVSVEPIDTGSYQVVVSLRVEWLGDIDPSSITEIVFIGPEEAGLMVRGAEGVDV